jgi:hypothetical protein
MLTRMMDDSQLPVSLLDLYFRGRGLHAQGVVVCHVGDHRDG